MMAPGAAAARRDPSSFGASDRLRGGAAPPSEPAAAPRPSASVSGRPVRTGGGAATDRVRGGAAAPSEPAPPPRPRPNRRRRRDKEAPSPPGAGAGIFWSVANLFGTLAVLRGGNALAVAQINAASLISSGLWGLLYYREIRGRAALYWCAAAVFTGAMTVMLSFEKA